MIKSSKSKQRSNAKKALEDIQNDRLRKIEGLKKDIEEGIYNIKGEIIAEKAIIRSILDDIIRKGKE